MFPSRRSSGSSSPRLTARPDTQVRVTLDQPPFRRMLARQDAVPGIRVGPVRSRRPSPVRYGSRRPGPAVTLDNGLVALTIDGSDGTFAVNGVPGFGRLVDSGDYGDTYNYSPPAVDTVVDAPDSVDIAVGERGPVRATVTITSIYTWPDRVDEATKSRVGAHQVAVETTLEVRADESVVRVTTRFDNPSRDHRVRVRLPLPEPSSTSQAECAFTVVERGLVAEGRPEEFGTPDLPLPPVRVERWPDRRPRGTARVRAGRSRAFFRRAGRAPSHGTGPHPVAGDGHAVPDGHDHPPDDGRADDPAGRPADARSGGRPLRHRRRRCRSVPTGRRRPGPPGRHRVVRRG